MDPFLTPPEVFVKDYLTSYQQRGPKSPHLGDVVARQHVIGRRFSQRWRACAVGPVIEASLGPVTKVAGVTSACRLA
jgi:hypothetical protein